MKNKFLLITLILAGAALVVLGIAGVNYLLTPKAPTPPPADTPSVQELSPESAETLAIATQILASVQPPQAIDQASTASGEIIPYTEIPLLSTGRFFEQALDDEHTAHGIEAYTLNKSGLLKVQIVWGIQTPDGFVYALKPTEQVSLEDAQTDAETRLVRGRLFAIAIAGTGCADFARLDWQACTRMEPGYASLFSLGERFQRNHSRANLLLISRIATQSSLNGWTSVGWPVVFPFVNDLVELP